MAAPLTPATLQACLDAQARVFLLVVKLDLTTAEFNTADATVFACFDLERLARWERNVGKLVARHEAQKFARHNAEARIYGILQSECFPACEVSAAFGKLNACQTVQQVEELEASLHTQLVFSQDSQEADAMEQHLIACDKERQGLSELSRSGMTIGKGVGIDAF